MNDLSPWRIRRLAEPEDAQPPYSHGSQQDEFHLSAYWNLIVKRRRLIILLFLVAFAPGLYSALTATKLYRASATIKIEPQNPQVTGVGALQPFAAGWQEYDYYRTQFALLKSRPLAASVIEDLKLESNHQFTDSRVVRPNPLDHIKSWIFSVVRFFSRYVALAFKSEPRADKPTTEADVLPSVKGQTIELEVKPRLIAIYQQFLDVAPVPKTRLVKVEFTTPDPDLSQVLANAHAQSFLQLNLKSRFTLTEEAREFLNQKRLELKGRWENSEAALNNFRQANGVVSVEKGENIVIDRLVDVNKQLTIARAQRIEAESLHRILENKGKHDLTEVMRQGLVQQLKGNVANLETEAARLATIFKPDHPRMQELGQQITAARQALNNEIANVIRGIEASYAAALAKERELQIEADKQHQNALKLKAVAIDYTLLQEEVNANRTLYENVLKRLSETNISNDIAVTNIEIVERAVRPLSPSEPDVPLYILASMVSGLFFGVGIAFVREYVASTVATPDDVRRAVGLSTLGVVPHLRFLNRPSGLLPGVIAQLKSFNRLMHRPIETAEDHAVVPQRSVSAKELITYHSPLSIMNEAYRTIRTFLLLSQAEKPPQVILLTSPSPAEGKTVTSLNLAIALAQDDRAVLLIDADMRQGICHDRLRLSNNRGLSHLLTSSGPSLDEGIQETPVRGLSLLSRGVPPPNPSELLGSRRMKDVVKELRQRFEFILIDSPPVIAISDAAIMSVITDGVVLVFDGHKTSTVSAQKAVERLDAVRARILGVILNAVNFDDPSYSYYRTHSHYYHDSRENNGRGDASVKTLDDTVAVSASTGAKKNGLQPKSRKTLREKINAVAMINRLTGGIQAHRNRRFQPNKHEHGESASKAHENDYAEPLEKTNEAATFQSANAMSTTRAESDVLSSDRPPGTVPEAFLNRLMDVFMEFVGPVAPFIVGHHIGLLGESKHAFPKSRIDELIKVLGPEISHPEFRLQFEKKIDEAIRNLNNH